MDKIVLSNNMSIIEEVIKILSNETRVLNPKEILWLVFGSYVINTNTTESDIDIIGIHKSFINKKRYVFNHKNIPIHFNAINMDDLKDDGESRLYGGYFTGKIINPHIFLYGNSKEINDSIYNAGKFIGPLAGYISKISTDTSFSQSQITAFVFIAYLSTDPSFDSYFLNYFISQEFEKIWECLQKNTVKMLIISGSIQRVDNKYIFTDSFFSYKDFHFERMKISARHWSYGVICHDNDIKFPDTMFTKANMKLKIIDPEGKKYANMVYFLKEQSGLSEIFI
ncbi:hypothetical protein A3C57_00350 [Candidatus Nomurabacteria bacterium RIFCSPHIGHO2_02_FULL_33_12]|nr:MAG: hypothetical protein A3C57_00350 [Candidatus Nomurabacteria bacterium RIFCSPHIGHO2_02_FULL_33_12]